MISKRATKASKGAGKQRHFSRSAAKNGDAHKHKLGRRGRKFPIYDRVASPDHEIILPGSSHHLEAKEQTGNIGKQEDDKNEEADKEGDTTQQDEGQGGREVAKGQATFKYKFSGSWNLEQLKKRHDELAEYIKTMREEIAAQKTVKQE